MVISSMCKRLSFVLEYINELVIRSINLPLCGSFFKDYIFLFYAAYFLFLRVDIHVYFQRHLRSLADLNSRVSFLPSAGRGFDE